MAKTAQTSQKALHVKFYRYINLWIYNQQPYAELICKALTKYTIIELIQLLGNVTTVKYKYVQWSVELSLQPLILKFRPNYYARIYNLRLFFNSFSKAS